MNDKYAIIQLGGKQFKVHEGDTFEVERQETIKPVVLAYSNGQELTIGTPSLKDVKVTAKAVEEKRAKRIVIQRFKAKSRHRRRQGHRQPMTVVLVEKIHRDGEVVKETKEAKEVKEVKAAKLPKTEKTIKTDKATKPAVKSKKVTKEAK